MLSTERGFVPFLSIFIISKQSATGKANQSCVTGFVNGILPACFFFHMRRSQEKRWFMFQHRFPIYSSAKAWRKKKAKPSFSVIQNISVTYYVSDTVTVN